MTIRYEPLGSIYSQGGEGSSTVLFSTFFIPPATSGGITNSPNPMKKDRYFYTRSRSLVEFLYAKGHPIVGLNPVESETEYVLPKTPYLEELVELYHVGASTHPELRVHVREFQQAQRQLEKLTQVNTNRAQVS